MKRFIERAFGLDRFWSHWQWYQDLFHISVFRYLIAWFSIVPVFAELLSKAPDTFVLTAGSTKLTLVLSLPFTWELLWTSSALFVLAFGLYKALCPKFIKEYSSYTAYASHGQSPRWIVRVVKDLIKDEPGQVNKLVERLNIKGYLHAANPKFVGEIPCVEVHSKTTDLVFMHNNATYQLSMPVIGENGDVDHERTHEIEREIFWEVFGCYSATRPIIRLTILVFLSVSGVLFLAVLGENILSALSYFGGE